MEGMMSLPARGAQHPAPVLGVPFHLLDYRGAFDTIEGWRRSGQRHYVVFANPHVVMSCRGDAQLSDALSKAGLVLPDGTGIILAAKMLRYQHFGRVTGPTFMLRMCDWGRPQGYRHYFCGGEPGVADRLADRLSAAYPGLQVAGTHSPPFRPLTPAEDEEIIQAINATRPDIVWVGLGAPKQEKWMAEHLGRIRATALAGVGAAFNFHSGTVPWAPAWVRSLGLEWAHRLLCEPRRLWRRNLYSALFLFGIVQDILAHGPAV
jgi:N-acetylglucosaminyldiphosphoundecaprenol N-acetyl-beta-D-mannosaminyltransferase